MVQEKKYSYDVSEILAIFRLSAHVIFATSEDVYKRQKERFGERDRGNFLLLKILSYHLKESAYLC